MPLSAPWAQGSELVSGDKRLGFNGVQAPPPVPLGTSIKQTPLEPWFSTVNIKAPRRGLCLQQTPFKQHLLLQLLSEVYFLEDDAQEHRELPAYLPINLGLSPLPAPGAPCSSHYPPSISPPCTLLRSPHTHSWHSLHCVSSPCDHGLWPGFPSSGQSWLTFPLPGHQPSWCVRFPLSFLPCQAAYLSVPQIMRLELPVTGGPRYWAAEDLKFSSVPYLSLHP